MLAVFLLYTSIAGAGTPQLQPSQLATAHRHGARSSARSSRRGGDAHGAAASTSSCATSKRQRERVPVVYHGTVPDLFRAGRDVVVSGTLAQRRLRRRSAARCRRSARRSTRRRRADVAVPELGRAALVAGLGLVVYALVAGSFAAWQRRRRLAVSAQNALLASFGDDRASRRPCCSPRSRGTTSRSPTSPTTRAASCRSATRCPRSGAARRARCSSGCSILTGYAAPRSASNRRAPRAARVGRAGARRRRLLLRVHARASSRARSRPQAAPADGAGLNPSLQNPYMIAHPPMLYLGYVGLTVPFAFAMGALLSRPHRRALDRRDAPLDARRLGVPRRRPAARRALGLRRDRLGRLLRVGSGRERGADAVARGDRVPALGDDPGEARDAEGLEHAARRARVLPLDLRHVPDALRRRSTRSTRSRRARSAAGSSASSSSAVVFARPDLPAAAAACARRRSSSRSSRARRRSSTTTCCSSRSA